MQIFPGKTIALNRVGRAEISTVELPRFPDQTEVIYETCVFYDDAPSEVFDRYTDINEAHRSHNIILMGMIG
jgi:hypothetical protein